MAEIDDVKKKGGRKLNSARTIVEAQDLAEVFNKYATEYAALPDTTDFPSKYYLINYAMNEALRASRKGSK